MVGLGWVGGDYGHRAAMTPVTYDSMRLLYRATLSMVSDASKQLWILSRLKSASLMICVEI